MKNTTTPSTDVVEIESAQATPASAQQSIRTIARLEQETMKHRALSERIGDAFTRVMGSLEFVVAHMIAFAAWFSINLGWIPGIEPFDPFPFGILTLIVSAEGVFLAIFVLLSQNRMSRLSSQRAHLNLQISLLAEQETTKLLQHLQRISDFRAPGDRGVGTGSGGGAAQPGDPPGDARRGAAEDAAERIIRGRIGPLRARVLL